MILPHIHGQIASRFQAIMLIVLTPLQKVVVFHWNPVLRQRKTVVLRLERKSYYLLKIQGKNAPATVALLDRPNGGTAAAKGRSPYCGEIK